MDTALIQRYQPGGDIYQKLALQYGENSAGNIAAAARTGDETQVNAAIVAAKYGAPLDDSTTDALVTQLATNPLAAPLDALNTVAGNTFAAFFKSPWVIGAIALGVFLAAGGGQWLFGLLKGKLK